MSTFERSSCHSPSSVGSSSITSGSRTSILMALLVIVSGTFSTVPALADVGGQSKPTSVLNMAESIRYQTISTRDPDLMDEKPFQDFQFFLRRAYPRVFAHLQVDMIANYSLLLTWQGSDASAQPVLFDAHYDVVPVEAKTLNDWSYPPFAGDIAEGYIWGRGTLDDKAAVISTLEALEALLAVNYQPKRTLLFSFVHDEEVGGRYGAANVAKHLKDKGVRLAYMIGEGGPIIKGNPLLPKRTIALISLAEKTYVTLTLSAKGDGGHSSMPVKNNALGRLAKAVSALHENPFSSQLVPPLTDMLDSFGEEAEGITGLMLRNRWLSAPLIKAKMEENSNSRALLRNTTAVTVFNAGLQENVIPQQAQAKINFRLLPGYSVEKLVGDVRAIIDDALIQIEVGDYLSAPTADLDGEGYRHIETAINQVLPSALVSPSMLPATTDKPKYAVLTNNLYGFHPFTVRMTDIQGIHGTDERISEKSFLDAVELSKALIQQAGN